MLVMEAITSKACQELICYETLETLGDAFLKFAVSVHLYRLFPRAHEGELLLLCAVCASVSAAKCCGHSCRNCNVLWGIL